MKVAVLGTGFGAEHAQIYERQTNVEQVIVWGRNPEKLEKLKNDGKVCVTTNMEDIWQDDSIDLVDVCLPNHLHREMAIKAMESGKNVYIETPIAETMEDAKQILATAQKTGKKAFVNLFMRFEYPYDYLYQVKQKRELGELKALYVKRDTPPWWGNLDPHEIGIQLMIHDVDFICRMLGAPDEIKTSFVQVRKNESIVSALMQYQNAYAQIQASSAMPGAHPFSLGYEAIFEKGTLRFYEDGYENNRTETKLSLFTANDRIVVPIQDSYGNEDEIKHVLACCEQNLPIQNSAFDAALALETVLRMNESMHLA
ncbi:MAG TPA: Gfo/Idh/MocA family oxidoreductase [Lachnospiraceae bacterium]|nr:Gfo/Idh/MocA family oxidoreductase [Lachnospiraceae bacterium]